MKTDLGDFGKSSLAVLGERLIKPIYGGGGAADLVTSAALGVNFVLYTYF